MTTNFVLQSAVNYPVALQLTAPVPGYAGIRNQTPFTLHLSSEDIFPHTVHLYAQNSRSAPYQRPQNKWSRLLAQWRFTDVDGNFIESITPTASTLVLGSSGETIGVRASAEFYYIDDRSTIECSPVLIWAIVDYADYPVYYDSQNCSNASAGYSNSKVGAVSPYFINGTTPNALRVTRNGVFDLVDFYWKDATIPHIITVQGNIAALSSYITIDLDTDSPIAFDVPVSNYYGNLGGSIVRSLSIMPSSTDLVWTPPSGQLFLSAYDAQDFDQQGFVKSSVVVAEEILNTTIQTSGVAYFNKVWSYDYYLWISNPENNTINRYDIDCVNSSISATAIQYLAEEQLMDPTISQNYDITQLQVTAVDGMSLSGFGGIYGIAIEPSYNFWASDAESDKIYKFSVEGDLLSSFDVSTIGETPAGISLDGTGYLWVSFFDSGSALKMSTTDGSFALVVGQDEPPVPEGIDNTFKPTLVETDMDSNVWISYTNSLSSSLYYYDQNGALLDTITLPTCSNPMDLHVSRNNNIWVTLTYHSGPDYRLGDIQLYSNTTGTLMSSYSAVHPEYITIDTKENLWITSDWNTVTKFTSAGVKTEFTVGTLPVPSWADTEKLEYNALEGICTDSFDNVYIINSVENKLYRISNDVLTFMADITPNNDYAFYNYPDLNTVDTDQYNKSAQAFGDWSGNRWQRKYNIGTLLSETSSISGASIEGQSTVFDVLDYTGLEIRRFNESWDASSYIHSFARSPHINNNSVLWDEYMHSLWGDEDSTFGQAYGRQSYERIANFTKNRADIEECNVSQIYDLASKTDVPIDDYGLAYPLELRRLMDIFSINQQKLWGTRCNCTYNIQNEYRTALSGTQPVAIESLCQRCGHLHAGNRGSLFEASTYMVTADVPFITMDKFLEKQFDLIIPTSILDHQEPYVTSIYLSGKTQWDDDYRITATSPTSSYVIRDEQRVLLDWDDYGDAALLQGETPNTLLSGFTSNITGLNIPMNYTIDVDLFCGWYYYWNYTDYVMLMTLNTGKVLTAYNTTGRIGGAVENPPASLPPDYYTTGPHFELVTDVGSTDLSQYTTNCYELCTVSTETLIYPLSTNYTWLLPNLYNATREPSYEDFQQVRNRFCFFDFIGSSCDEQVAGVINWDDKNTTLNEHASSLDEWYGSGEAVEKMISYVLHKGLGLIEE